MKAELGNFYKHIPTGTIAVVYYIDWDEYTDDVVIRLVDQNGAQHFEVKMSVFNEFWTHVSYDSIDKEVRDKLSATYAKETGKQPWHIEPAKSKDEFNGFKGEFAVAVNDGNKWIVKEMEDNRVNHPSYYQDPSGVECIDVVRHRDFDIGSAMKYLWRAGLKKEQGLTDIDKEIEDLKKAKFYIDDKINMLTKQKVSIDNNKSKIVKANK